MTSKKFEEQRENLELQRKIIEDINKGFFDRKVSFDSLNHYTSIRTLFEMLESDTLWVSKTRFSNDSSEEKVLNFSSSDYDIDEEDNYMFCMSTLNNSLSQWRGYCHDGGVSVNLSLRNVLTYSVLHKDYDTSKKYERVVNAPLPIIYVNTNSYLNSSNGHSRDQELIEKHIRENITSSSKQLTLNSFRPFIKSDEFIDEHEYRLLFSNRDGNLSKCIRFRTLKNDVKVPYMVVKVGDIAEEYTKCDFDVKELTKEHLLDLANNRQPTIKIPQGSNQEAIYYQVEGILNSYVDVLPCKISIECDGHLPINEIIVSPTYDRNLLAEEIRRYCKSKYWLRGVKVTYSTIPYIPPSE